MFSSSSPTPHTLPIHLLGCPAEPRQLADLSKRLLWFSYRCHFAAPLRGTSFRTDARWGCLARTAQMMVGNALLRFFTPQPSPLRPPWLYAAPPLAPSPRDYMLLIAQLFLDSPSALFSIHALCQEGELLGLPTGQWFAPSVICNVLERLSSSAHSFSSSSSALNPHYHHLPSAPYTHEPYTHEPYTHEPPATQLPHTSLTTSFIMVPQHPSPPHTSNTDPNLFPSAYSPTSYAPPHSSSSPPPSSSFPPSSFPPSAYPASNPPPPPIRCVSCPNSTLDVPLITTLLTFMHTVAAPSPLLLLVPTRLGIDRVHPVYVPQIVSFFALPQCLGILGGRQGSSYYFLGSSGDQTLFYFDPHTVQTSIDPARLDSLATFQSPRLESMPFSQLDTSLAFGFYCADLDDLSQIVAWASTCDVESPLVSLGDSSQPADQSLASFDETMFQSAMFHGAQLDAPSDSSLNEQDFVAIGVSPFRDLTSPPIQGLDESFNLLAVGNQDGEVKVVHYDSDSGSDEFVIL